MTTSSLNVTFFVLIESDWNLKLSAFGKLFAIVFGINRIRLEFKVFGASGGHLLGGGINRIRLEFKGL